MWEKIKAVALDVDGVLTDGTFWWGPNDEELKRFCFADVTGIPLAQKAGLVLALISGESSPAGMAIVERYARKLKITDVYKGSRDKSAALRDFAGKHGLDLSEVCFIGDDINDLPAMAIVGLSVAPPNAHSSVLGKASMITEHKGGHGALREVLDLLLDGRSLGPNAEKKNKP